MDLDSSKLGRVLITKLWYLHTNPVFYTLPSGFGTEAANAISLRPVGSPLGLDKEEGGPEAGAVGRRESMRLVEAEGPTRYCLLPVPVSVPGPWKQLFTWQCPCFNFPELAVCFFCFFPIFPEPSSLHCLRANRCPFAGAWLPV